MKQLLLLFIFTPLFLVAQPKSSDSNFNVISKDSSAKLIEQEFKITCDQKNKAQIAIFKEALDKRNQVILAESAIIILLSCVILAQSMKIKRLKTK